MCAQREGRRNEGVGLARLDPLAAPQGARPDKTGPATAENCTGGQTRRGVSPPYRCAQRRKQGEEGVGLTRPDPLAAHQRGRPDKAGPATAKNCTGGQTGGGGYPHRTGAPSAENGARKEWA